MKVKFDEMDCVQFTRLLCSLDVTSFFRGKSLGKEEFREKVPRIETFSPENLIPRPAKKSVTFLEKPKLPT